MKESEIEKKVCDYAKTLGGIAYKFVSPARRSVPDRLFVMPGGISFFVEFKTPTGKLTTGQEREIRRLRDQGQFVYIISDVELGKTIIDLEMKDADEG